MQYIGMKTIKKVRGIRQGILVFRMTYTGKVLPHPLSKTRIAGGRPLALRFPHLSRIRYFGAAAIILYGSAGTFTVIKPLDGRLGANRALA